MLNLARTLSRAIFQTSSPAWAPRLEKLSASKPNNQREPWIVFWNSRTLRWMEMINQTSHWTPTDHRPTTNSSVSQSSTSRAIWRCNSASRQATCRSEIEKRTTGIHSSPPDLALETTETMSMRQHVMKQAAQSRWRRRWNSTMRMIWLERPSSMTFSG